MLAWRWATPDIPTWLEKEATIVVKFPRQYLYKEGSGNGEGTDRFGWFMSAGYFNDHPHMRMNPPATLWSCSPLIQPLYGDVKSGNGRGCP